MGIIRRCRGRCSTPRRCLEHLWFDVMYRGSRFRMPVNEFAVPRMELRKQRPIQSMGRKHVTGSVSSSARFRPAAIHVARERADRRTTPRRRALRSSLTPM